jgi:hypothetical protein
VIAELIVGVCFLRFIFGTLSNATAVHAPAIELKTSAISSI